MIKKYFKCTLLSDVVFNASLATEGNMTTLDYIPGSNFLGIVAGEGRYKAFKDEGKAYDIFHSGKVSFGDAHIAMGDAQSYPMPFSLFQDKLKEGIPEHDVYVNPYVNNPNQGIQWEQIRVGYFDPDNSYIKKIEAKFSLKSAQDRNERRSKEGAMFGFESLRKGQSFIFSVDFNDETYVDAITTALTEGTKRIGKSKTAQFGQVDIQGMEPPAIFNNGPSQKNQLTIYAESNLCFLNDLGQATFQPSAKDFGVTGKIDWDRSQIRTYSYSPWNFKRNTTNTQRDCILKGSVIVFVDHDDNLDVDNLPKQVGEYKEEGLGRVIYNPDFLNFKENGLWSIKLKKYEKDDSGDLLAINPTTDLGIFLNIQKAAAEEEFKIGLAVQEFIKKQKKMYADVSPSQWGEIRSRAVQSKDLNSLTLALFSKESGILMKGVAAEKYWDKNNGLGRNVLQETIEQDKFKSIGLKFVAKLASEMAKEAQKNELNETN